MAEAKCTHPPRGEADAYHIAEFISRDEKTAADMLYERIVRERKLTRAEAAMLATMALRFSIKYQANFERKQSLTEDEKEGIKRGEFIAEVLQLKRDKNTDRYNTTWGTKTSLGLYLTVKRLVEEPLVFGK